MPWRLYTAPYLARCTHRSASPSTSPRLVTLCVLSPRAPPHACRSPLADGAQFKHLHREYKGVYMSLPEARAEHASKTKDARRQARACAHTHYTYTGIHMHAPHAPALHLHRTCAPAHLHTCAHLYPQLQLHLHLLQLLYMRTYTVCTRTPAHALYTCTCTPAAGGPGARAQPGASRDVLGGGARTGGGTHAGCDRRGARGDQGVCVA